MIPKKTGISPDPAAESKVGQIPLCWHGTVASLPARAAPFGQARAPAVARTPARERAVCRTTAGKCMTRTTQTCPKICQVILKCPNTHERAQLASRAGIQIPYATSSWRYMGLRKLRGRTRENRNQTIKCRTKIKESNTTCNTTIPYHLSLIHI